MYSSFFSNVKNARYFLKSNCKKLCQVLTQRDKGKESSKIAADVISHLESVPEYKNIINQLPPSLLKKYKTPESMYLINKNTAKKIASFIKEYSEDTSSIVEVNPGFGYVTEQLLLHQKSELYLFETLNHFSPFLSPLLEKYKDRLCYKCADFFGIWKLAYQDKLDQGSRMEEFLGNLINKDDGRILRVVGAMPGLTFIKNLIQNVTYHVYNNQLGRIDCFIVMPGHNYEFLTEKEVKQGKHKYLPSLFQILFDYEIITNVPKYDFLPWTFETSKKKYMMNEYCLYLVRITQKEKCPCPQEYMPVLKYFFKKNVFSTKTRIIPALEQWLPGCGVWLITDQDPPDTNAQLSPTSEDEALPHMNIFTQFGDLTLAQKVTLFKRFISWPEFEHCSFRISAESNARKATTIISDSQIEDSEHSEEENES